MTVYTFTIVDCIKIKNYRIYYTETGLLGSRSLRKT